MPVTIGGSGPITGVTSINTTVSDTELGYLDGVSSALQTQINGKLAIAGGKILQIVRATDASDRTTTSTTFVDASISVTITPTFNTSLIFLIWTALLDHSVTSDFAGMQITDASNNQVGGPAFIGSTTTARFQSTTTVIGWAAPATTNATTYKGRFRVFSSGTTSIFNSSCIGQLFAFEVSA